MNCGESMTAQAAGQIGALVGVHVTVHLNKGCTCGERRELET